ncbi:MAG: glycosyltransferase [Hadesarchaea archaeon]|nr:glycosyltransferase [Hadesarchaea archaeon]
MYGTVFNNADTVELSIRSIFSALEDVIEEVVVVDNYSYDGTWEILNELKKELPLRLYRLKCSRGLGRQYAFTKTRSKYVLSMDFDTIYLKDFGLVV